jgi:Peptidase family M28
MKNENLEARAAAKHWRLSLASILFLIAATGLAVYDRPYPAAAPADVPATEFSSARAMAHLRQIAKAPHPTGTLENREVGDYIRQQLLAAGLQPELQEADYTDLNHEGYRVSHVRNIVAVKKGTGGGKPILLMGHYDSVITGPGASDDGAAVACMLETLRALQAGAQLKNDVIFLFTDGEELGLVGSRAFVAQHPWAKDLGVVLNFEARGTSGPSVLFETINGDDWLVREFAAASPNPYGNSLLPAIFKVMPNDTDLTAFKGTSVPGLNFAFAEGWSHYHTRLDSLDSLNERSLQHHGEYALALTRRLGQLDLANPPRGNAVFFNLLGATLAHYPASWAPVLSGFAALCLLAVLVVGFRRKRLSVWGLLLGLLALPLVVAAASFVCAFCVRFAARASAEGVAFFSSPFYYGGVVCLGLAVAAALYALLSRWTRAENLQAGAMVWWLALTVVTTALLPGATYVFTWPLLVACALSLYLMLRPAGGELGNAGALWLGAGLVLLVVAPVVYLILLALAGPMGFIVTFLVVLTAALLLPLYQLVARPGAAWAPALTTAAAVALFAVAVRQARPGPDYPKEDQVFYADNLDQGKAAWVTLEQSEDGWTSQFFDGQGRVSDLSTLMPDYLYGNAPMLERSAPALELAPPTVSVVKDETPEGDRRLLRLSVNSPRRCPELFVFVESDAGVRMPELTAALPASQRAALPGSNALAAGGGEPRGGAPVSVEFEALPSEGATLLLETKKGVPLKLHVIERSYELPQVPGLEVKPRGAEFQAVRSLGDGTITYRSFTF